MCAKQPQGQRDEGVVRGVLGNLHFPRRHDDRDVRAGGRERVEAEGSGLAWPAARLTSS